MTYLIVQVHFFNFTVNSTHSSKTTIDTKTPGSLLSRCPLIARQKCQTQGSLVQDLQKTFSHPWEAMGVPPNATCTPENKVILGDYGMMMVKFELIYPFSKALYLSYFRSGGWRGGIGVGALRFPWQWFNWWCVLVGDSSLAFHMKGILTWVIYVL